MKNLYEILDVESTATDDEIKKAYRKKAQETHPDKGGGTELFQEINKAYQILSDSEKREYYDATGCEKNNNIETEVVGALIQIVMSTLQNHDPKYNNLIALAQKMVNHQQSQYLRNKSGLEAQVDRLKDASSRISVVDGKENVISSSIIGHIKDVEAHIEETTKIIRIGERILEMLKDYSYRTEQLRSIWAQPTSATFQSTTG